jgi:hypothetical protein
VVSERAGVVRQTDRPLRCKIFEAAAEKLRVYSQGSDWDVGVKTPFEVAGSARRARGPSTAVLLRGREAKSSLRMTGVGLQPKGGKLLNILPVTCDAHQHSVEIHL